MSRPVANLRMFVAAYPPPEIARDLVAAVAGLDLPDHRPVPPEQVHLTLQFIGDVPVRELDACIESVSCAARGLGPAELRPERLISLPEGAPPRLVAARTDAPPTVGELHRRLVTRFARSRRRGGDRFLPHLTLARFRDARGLASIDEPLALAAFAVREIRLMRSRLGPAGARHEVVERIELA